MPIIAIVYPDTWFKNTETNKNDVANKKFASQDPIVDEGWPTTLNVSSSPLEVFLGKGVLKIYSKFTREHPCRSVIWKLFFIGKLS